MRIYLPQFYKENLPYVELAGQVIGAESVDQYRNEERSLLRRRLKLAKDTLADLLAAMHHDELAPEANVRQLAAELAGHHDPMKPSSRAGPWERSWPCTCVLASAATMCNSRDPGLKHSSVKDRRSPVL